MADSPAGPSNEEWEQILDAVTIGSVVPVIGPSMVTVVHPDTDEIVPLYSYLAPQFASKLGLSEPERFEALGPVVQEYFAQPDAPAAAVPAKLMPMFRELEFEPMAPLAELARITDFDLYITTTADFLMQRALDRERMSFVGQDHTIRFVPSGRSESPFDLPDRWTGPILYHLLGDATGKDFAVWDEDYVEFVCALIEKREGLRNLFHELQECTLLLLGSPSEDWIVRFLLRTAFGRRLSEHPQAPYIASRNEVDSPLAFFVRTTMKKSIVIPGDPCDFAIELGARWRARKGVAQNDEDFIAKLPEYANRHSVFISYAHEDLAVAAKLARALLALGVDVWLDKRRLKGGDHYESALENAVKHDCGFFVSLISSATEADAGRERFVHKERDWAAQRQTGNALFYIPFAIDLPTGDFPQREPLPISFRSGGDADPVHVHRYDPHDLKSFAVYLRSKVDERRRLGRQPRR